MKAVFVLCIVAVSVILVQGGNKTSGATYVPCAEGQHPVVCPDPEPTCDNPTPVSKPKPSVCVCMACRCDHPTIRDSKTGECVNLDSCS